MNTDQIAAVLANPISVELLNGPTPARLAYTATDGSPRVVPIGFGWDGKAFRMWTTPKAPKVRHLQADPRVALTIDTAGLPPRVLLVRGTAALETVDGVPDGFVEATRRTVPAEAMPEWEAGVRALYARMTVVTVTPTWVKLLDFETTIPQAVQELVDAQPQGSPH
jgi:hypothetical protein